MAIIANSAEEEVLANTSITGSGAKSADLRDWGQFRTQSATMVILLGGIALHANAAGSASMTIASATAPIAMIAFAPLKAAPHSEDALRAR